MRAAVRQIALARRRAEHKVQQAFDQYMDHAVDRLVELGVSSEVALDAIFQTVTYLAEEEVLPPFPTERASYEEAARWLVAAADFGLVDFLLEAAEEEAAENDS